MTFELDDEDEVWLDDECSWCGGQGVSECDDPFQCFTPGCDGELCMCLACDGRGYGQRIW